MGRRRTVSDKELLDAALRLVQGSGPAALTFAAVSQATGLAPATLVQRFGAKDALVEATLLHAWDELDERTTLADERFPLSERGAVELLGWLADAPGQDVYDNGMLMLREDFRNPRLRARGRAWQERMTLIVGRRLAREEPLRTVLGRALLNHWQGALVWAGFSQDADLNARLRGELTALLELIGRRAK